MEHILVHPNKLPHHLNPGSRNHSFTPTPSLSLQAWLAKEIRIVWCEFSLMVCAAVGRRLFEILVIWNEKNNLVYKISFYRISFCFNNVVAISKILRTVAKSFFIWRNNNYITKRFWPCIIIIITIKTLRPAINFWEINVSRFDCTPRCTSDAFYRSIHRISKCSSWCSVWEKKNVFGSFERNVWS